MDEISEVDRARDKSKRLKILHIAGWYPSRENPAAGVFVREHVKAAALYTNVKVLHCAGPASLGGRIWHMVEEADYALTEGIHTYRVWWRYSPTAGISRLLSVWAGMRAVDRVVASGFRPDVIHAHVFTAALPALLSGARFRVPVVLTEHYTGFLGYPPLNWRDRWLARLVGRWVRVILPVSQALRDGMERIGVRGRYVIVPNTVDVHLFEPSGNGADGVTVSFGKKRLVTVALLTPQKDIPVLLHALQILLGRRSDFVLDIVGDGPQRPDYEELAAKLGLSEVVQFHGLQPKRDVVRFLHNAAIFVLPTLCETFGVVLIEALAAGKPVVASAVGAVSEIITPEVGRVVPPGDSQALAVALDEMLDSYHQYDARALAQYARERYSYEVVGRQLYEIYVKVHSDEKV